MRLTASAQCTTQKKTHISEVGSSSGTQGTLRLCSTATIAMTKECVKAVRKLIKNKQTQRVADAYAHRIFDDKLDPRILGATRRNAKKFGG